MNTSILSIWLEFEEWVESPPEQRDFFNMKIRLRDGRAYALNVWTFRYAEQAKDELYEECSFPIFVLGPDLIVDVADRATLEAVAERLVQKQLLREQWLVSSSPPDPG